MTVPGVPATVAITVVPARNWTWVTVTPAPEPGATVALTVVADPTVTTAPSDGAVTVAVGAEFPAVTATAVEVTCVAAESSATAVRL